jgi:hypothetical protein
VTKVEEVEILHNNTIGAKRRCMQWKIQEIIHQKIREQEVKAKVEEVESFPSTQH